MSVHLTNQAKPDQTDSRGIILTMNSSVHNVEKKRKTILRNIALPFSNLDIKTF